MWKHVLAGGLCGTLTVFLSICQCINFEFEEGGPLSGTDLIPGSIPGIKNNTSPGGRFITKH